MISFDAHKVEMPALDYKKLEIWLGMVAASFSKRIGSLNYLFCDDEEILKVNRKFLNHDYFTDIITFDYSHCNRIGGDIYISVDTVRSNAYSLGFKYSEELLRVIVHGLLHLCGINDKTREEREVMEAQEDKALEIFKTL